MNIVSFNNVFHYLNIFIDVLACVVVEKAKYMHYYLMLN